MNKLKLTYLEDLIKLENVKFHYPLSSKINSLISKNRSTISKILFKKDKRILVIVGPCSIHDRKSTLEYGKRLKKIRDIFFDRLEIVMRVYFEKPRSINGWKGLIVNPKINNRILINEGLSVSRKILLELNELELPIATEFLYPEFMPYIFDFISWGCIGARTVDSQIHREMSSALPIPIGFKNSVYGNIEPSINAILCARSSHHFITQDSKGKLKIFKTKGNTLGHLVLRGGKFPNFYKKNIDHICYILKKNKILPYVIVDCSHGNSKKSFTRQIKVIKYIAKQIREGNKNIVGVMIESNLNENNQKIGKSIEYGKSITDECIGWKDTKKILKVLYDSVKI